MDACRGTDGTGREGDVSGSAFSSVIVTSACSFSCAPAKLAEEKDL